MAKNEVQMQIGFSLDNFSSTYGTEEQCEAAVEKSKWPSGFCCTKCGAYNPYIYRKSTGNNSSVKVFQCSYCRKQVTLNEGTIFQSTKLPLTKWFQAMLLMTQSKNNISALELRRLLGVSYPAAWRVKHKLMQVMYERELTTVLSGRVEADDAYLGGELQGGKAGRGSENKIPFIAAVQTNSSGNPIYAVFRQVKRFSLEEIKAWANTSLAPKTVVVSDGLNCFPGVTDAGCVHQPEIVGKARKSTSMECFKWVNTILGNLKTAASGTYHAFSFEKYGYRYLGEAQYRFNRRFNLKTILPRLITAAAQTGARSERFLRMAEA